MADRLIFIGVSLLEGMSTLCSCPMSHMAMEHYDPGTRLRLRALPSLPDAGLLTPTS